MKRMFLAAILAAIAFPVNATLAAPDVKNFGKGVWTYYLNKTGSAEEIADRAQWAGLDYVIIKTHDGARWHQNWKSGRAQKLITLLRSRGIKAYTYGFNYGNHPEEEAQRVIESLNGSDGYIYNVEGPFTRRRNPSDVQERAETICHTVWQYRERYCPDKPLGYSTYCRIHIGAGRSMRDSGVFRVFGRYCDVAMPQAYWSVFRQTPRHTLWEMCQQWAAMEEEWRIAGYGKSVKPIIPTGVSYRPDISRSAVPVEQFVGFMDASKGYYGINIYVWHEMSDAHWAALRNFQAKPEDNGEPEEYKQLPPAEEQRTWEIEEEEIRKSEPSAFRVILWWCLKRYLIFTPLFILFCIGFNRLSGIQPIARPVVAGLLWPVPIVLVIGQTIYKACCLGARKLAEYRRKRASRAP